MTYKLVQLFVGSILCVSGIIGCYAALVVLVVGATIRPMSGVTLFAAMNALISYRGYSIMNGEEI